MYTLPSTNLHACALHCLMLADPLQKAAGVQTLATLWREQQLQADAHPEARSIPEPGRPPEPALVHPSQVPKRSTRTPAGRIRLAHAIAHIEFNAINLALDAIYRFRDMPQAYYTDWIRVAQEEAKHFGLLSRYLQQHGSFYGEFDAHNGLWEMALKTDDDVLVRMALVPRVLEARGLDVTPGMIQRLEQTGDSDLIDILRIIFEEEIGHVKIGSRWFHYCCQLRHLEPENTFIELLQRYMKNGIAGPFETAARIEAGFSEEEMQRIQQLAASSTT